MKASNKSSRSAPAGEPPDTGLSAAAKVFDYTFEDNSLLLRALTHRSLAYEIDPRSVMNPNADNEQLEFVGDAVLGLIVAEALFRRFPQSHEGELTQLRASLISRKHLSAMAVQLDLGSMLRLGKGEERSGGRAKAALLSNALEAVIAAIYLDGGLQAAQRFVELAILDPVMPGLNLALAEQISENIGESGAFSGAVGDHKSALQEHLQAIGAGQPEYVLLAESGPDHRKRFRVEVRTTTDGISTVLAESEGSTKKAAQQEAARLAFNGLIHRKNSAVPSVEARQP